MTIPPIIERELRVALRHKRVLRTRLIVAGVSSLLALQWLLVVGGGSRSSVRAGRQLFEFLFVGGCVLAVVETLRVTCDLLAVERRNQTLGLIFLSGMSALDVLVSKLASGAWMAFCNLLALLPCFSIAILAGGVSTDSVLSAAVCLPALLSFVLAIGILGSALRDDANSALFTAMLTGLIVCLLAPALCVVGQRLGGRWAISSDWLFLSPAFGPFLVFNRYSSGSLREVLLNGAGTAAWSLAILLVAAQALKRSWQDQPFRRLPGLLGKYWPARPSLERSVQRRRQWLLAKPYGWLVIRETRPLITAWAVVGSVTVLWLLGWWLVGKPWAYTLNVLLTSVLLCASVGWCMVYATAKRIGEDRRSGAYELLLTTPLDVSLLIDDQAEAVGKQFARVWWAVGSVCTGFLIPGLFSRDWSWPAVAVGLMALAAVGMWSALFVRSGLAKVAWISLNSGRPAYALLSAYLPSKFIGLKLLSIAFIFRGAARVQIEWGAFPAGTAGEFLVLVVLTFLPLVGLMIPQLGSPLLHFQLRSEFRHIARLPVPEPNDPRFAKWDQRKPFPTPR